MKINTLFLASLLFLTFYGAMSQNYKIDLDNRPNYLAHKATAPILVDGKLDDENWQKSEVRSIDYFHLAEEPLDKQKTNFRMIWDEETIYLFYQSEDKYLTSAETLRDGQPYLDDCAEIFLIPVPDSASMHFCFEINLFEAKNDVIYINDFYKNKDFVIKAFNPDYAVKVDLKGTINDNSDIDEGWTMELAIPMTAFEGSHYMYPIKQGTKWAFLAIRQERNSLEPGRRVMSTIFPVQNIEKGVHQPNMFGLVEFVD